MLSAIQLILSLLVEGLPVAEELIALGQKEYSALTGGAPLSSADQAAIDAAYAASQTAVQTAQPGKS